MLFNPDFSWEFILHTDALNIGLGTVLSQDFGGEEHPILYLSRKLFPREKSYFVIEKEALMIKWAVDAFRYYLLCSYFSLIADLNPPLRWIQTMRDKNPLLMR